MIATSKRILVVERVQADGRAFVVFAQSDSAFYGMNREWWRDEAKIVGGVLVICTETTDDNDLIDSCHKKPSQSCK
mgnify:CR=1 FL=1